jgi:hypothetical protein
MLQGGENGHPHANYGAARDEAALRRTIERAHLRGLKVGLYCRGIERYGLDVKFFERYCRYDWDGLYVDWHGPQCVAYHEHQFPADAAVHDRHFSSDGSSLAARDYFLFLRRLRETVGPSGFLIGHQGFGASGVFANLNFDAYLPGEAEADHTMFADRDQAVYGGMMGGGLSNPWTVDAPAFRSPEAVAKMAAWGFFPHVVLGMRRAVDGIIFPLDPDDKVNEFALPYWRLLSSIDMSRAQVFNLPNQGPVAASCADGDFQTVVYKEHDRSYLVIVSNLGTRTKRSIVNLLPEVLGLTGSYSIRNLNGRSLAATLQANSTPHFETDMLQPWGIEGYRLIGESTPRPELSPLIIALGLWHILCSDVREGL